MCKIGVLPSEDREEATSWAEVTVLKRSEVQDPGAQALMNNSIPLEEEGSTEVPGGALEILKG